MKIANIIYDQELVKHEKKNFINYICPPPSSLIDINLNLPTLFVGWNVVKDNPNINSANILDKTIVTNKLFWEFSYKEKKSEYFKGIDNFINNAPIYYFKYNYKYINLDPIFFNISNIEDLKHILPKESQVIYNYKNEMLYIFYNNVIWGIDLKMYGYFNFDVVELKVEILKRNKLFIDDIDGDQYIEQYKNFPNFEELKRYMPVILSFDSIYKESN